MLLLAAAVAEYGQLNGASSETHCFARRRCPDVNALAAHEGTSVGHQILTTVSSGVEPHARTQRQVSWISSDQSFRNRSSARSAPAQTVRSSNVVSRRHNIGFFDGNLFAEATCGSDGCWLWILRRMNLCREKVKEILRSARAITLPLKIE